LQSGQLLAELLPIGSFDPAVNLPGPRKVEPPVTGHAAATSADAIQGPPGGIRKDLGGPGGEAGGQVRNPRSPGA
ncbi:MAG: hypothetical protein ACK559_42120, partial [bacterium]